MKVVRLIVEIIGWIVISLIASSTILIAFEDEWPSAEPGCCES